MAFLPTNAAQVQQFAVALYGIKVGTATMAAVQADITNVGGLNKALNAYYTASFGSSTTAAVAATVAANLGLTGTAATDAAAYITAVLNGTSASARGEAIQGVLNLFSTLTSNATFGAAATAWNTKVEAAIAYTGAGDAAVVAGAAVDGSAFTLTTGVDTFVGTAGNDSFVASNTTLTLLDNLSGGAGTDTLAITDASATAFTLPVTTSTFAGIENFAITHIADATAATDAVTADLSNVADARSVTIVNGGSTPNVTVTGSGNLTSVTIDGGAAAGAVGVATIADAGTDGLSTADKISTITLTGITGVGTLSSEALTTLNLNAAAGVATNTDTVATDARALTVNFNGGTNGGATDAGATAVAVNVKAATANAGTNTFAAATSASLTVDAVLTAGSFVTAAATSVNVAANAKITAATVTATAATALNLSGSAAQTLTQSLAAAAVITNNSSGAVTLNTAIAAGQQYIGGTGVDTVTFAATGTKASTLGAGDDVATFTAVAGTGGSVDAGEGVDTVSLAYADAVTLSATADAFEDDIANFEKVGLAAIAATTAATGTADTSIALANLDSINSVTLAGAGVNSHAQTNTISGFSDAGKFELTALLGTKANVALTGSFTGAANTFTLAAKGTDGFVNAGSLTLADVENIAITLDDSDTTAATAQFDLNLDAVAASAITVTGDAGITFANSSYTALRSLDASGVTAAGAAGIVTFTANAVDTTAIGGAGNDVLTGGAANDVLTGNAGTDTLDGAGGNDTISGGDGVDTITGGTGKDVLTGGAGNDIFVFATGTGALASGDAAATADQITDFAATDILRLDASDNVAAASPTGSTAATTDVFVATGGKVTFAAADDTLAKKLVAVAADDTDVANGEVVFFEDSGNTYIYGAGDATATATDDFLIVLVGVTGRATLAESTATAGDFTLV